MAYNSEIESMLIHPRTWGIETIKTNKMSLDVSLYSKERKTVMCYHCMHEYEEQELFYTANITHNLGDMADKAGIYMALWRPGEIGAKYARDIIEVVERGLSDLKAKPKYFEQFDSPNGWGLYKHFVPFVESYLDALKKYPDAEIHVSI